MYRNQPIIQSDSSEEEGNQDLEPIAPQIGNMNVDQVLNALNLLTNNQQNMQNNIENLTQALAGMQVQAAAPGPVRPPKITSTTFPTLELPRDENDAIEAFHSWEAHVRNLVTANPLFDQLQFNQLASGILASTKGRAHYILSQLPIDEVDDLDQLMDRARTMIAGGGLAERAQIQFNMRVQHLHEDVPTYAAHLHTLYVRAYPPNNRPWITLRDGFLRGLRDNNLRDQIVTSFDDPPGNWNDLVRLVSDQEAKRQKAKQFRQGHKAMEARTNTYYQPQYAADAGAGAAAGPVPMEVDAAQQKKRKQVAATNATTAKQNQAQAGNKKGNKKAAATQVSNANTKSEKVDKGKKEYRIPTCHSCGQVGHISPNCPTKPKKATANAAMPIQKEEFWGSANAAIDPNYEISNEISILNEQKN